MEHNKELATAWDFVEHTGTSIFLTGKAGTGKTTFLKTIKERSSKRMIVVAPTGVAAINAAGMTIHFSYPSHRMSLELLYATVTTSVRRNAALFGQLTWSSLTKFRW